MDVVEVKGPLVLSSEQAKTLYNELAASGRLFDVLSELFNEKATGKTEVLMTNMNSQLSQMQEMLQKMVTNTGVREISSLTPAVGTGSGQGPVTLSPPESAPVTVEKSTVVVGKSKLASMLKQAKKMN